MKTFKTSILSKELHNVHPNVQYIIFLKRFASIFQNSFSRKEFIYILYITLIKSQKVKLKIFKHNGFKKCKQ